ncbi:MAG TPA: glycosyltransferase family 4 protein [Allosphingosinicella sp.]|nr:glycosyltransferase family 4 protein [Allosphingosinicella sp.]
MRLLYPLMWSRPDRKACREQSVNTVAALARRGVEATLLMPRGAGDPVLTAADLRDWFGVEGEFSLVQRESRWAGEALGRTLFWLRQVFRDPEVGQADLLYSRIPAMLGMGARAPLPFAVDHYRPWPDDLPAIRPLVRRTARSPVCLGFVLHSEFAAGAYRRAGVPGEKLLVAHNGAEPRRMGPPAAKAGVRTALGLDPNRFTAVYAGRVNAQKGLDALLALADLRPETLFLLVGSEGEGPVETDARRRPNVRVVPWQEPAALPAWLHAADVLLIPPSRAPLEQFRNCVLPLKLFSYLAAGRPILAPEAPDTAELLTDGENALLVPPGDPAAAAAALDRLREPALADRLGAAALARSGELTWDRRAEKIEAFLKARLSAR